MAAGCGCSGRLVTALVISHRPSRSLNPPFSICIMTRLLLRYELLKDHLELLKVDLAVAVLIDIKHDHHQVLWVCDGL